MIPFFFHTGVDEILQGGEQRGGTQSLIFQGLHKNEGGCSRVSFKEK